MKLRRVKNGYAIWQRLHPDADHPRFAVGVSSDTPPEQPLFQSGRYSRAVNWAKQQPTLLTMSTPRHQRVVIRFSVLSGQNAQAIANHYTTLIRCDSEAKEDHPDVMTDLTTEVCPNRKAEKEHCDADKKPNRF